MEKFNIELNYDVKNINKIIDFIFEYPYSLWEIPFLILFPRKNIQNIGDPKFTKKYLIFLEKIQPHNDSPAELKNKILEHRQLVPPLKEISPTRYISFLKKKKLVTLKNGKYNKTPFYDLFLELTKYFSNFLHKKISSHKELNDFFEILSKTNLSKKELIRLQTETFFLIHLYKEDVEEISWKLLNQKWIKFLDKYPAMKEYFSNLRYLNLFIEQNLLIKNKEEKTYHLNHRLISELIQLLGTTSFHMTIFSLMTQLGIYLPVKHFIHQLNSTNIQFKITPNARDIVYGEILNSQKEVKTFLLFPLVGEDILAGKTLKNILGKRIQHRTLLFLIPKKDSMDDIKIREIIDHGGKIKIVLEDEPNYSPFVIIDDEKIINTFLQLENKSMSPVVITILQDNSSIEKISSEWKQIWKKSAYYQEIIDGINLLYEKTILKKPIEIPKNHFTSLLNYGIIDEKGKLTKIGENILFKRIY